MNTEHDMPAPNYARRIYWLIIGLVVAVVLGVGGFLIYHQRHQADLAQKCRTEATAEQMLHNVNPDKFPASSRDC